METFQKSVDLAIGRRDFPCDIFPRDDTLIANLTTYCGTGDNKLITLLDLQSQYGAEHLRIRISNSSSDHILNCLVGGVNGQGAYAERYAYTKNSGVVKVGVSVW